MLIVLLLALHQLAIAVHPYSHDANEDVRDCYECLVAGFHADVPAETSQIPVNLFVAVYDTEQTAFLLSENLFRTSIRAPPVSHR